MARPQRCHHKCPCGAELICADAERCAVLTDAWQCPSCELAAFDAYINRLTSTNDEQETTHDEHQQRLS